MPTSNIIRKNILKNKNKKEKDDFTFQHIQEIYKINTTTPLI